MTGRKDLLDLLELQAVDSEIDRLKERRQSLPELEQYRSAAGELEKLRRVAAEQEEAVAQITQSVNRAQGELELREQKRASEEQRMYAGGINARDLQNLQSELEMLSHQIASGEDEILSALDEKDAREGELNQTRDQIAGLETEHARLEQTISDEWKRIDTENASLREKREVSVQLIPAGLLELYEEIRPHKEGVAVGRLAEGVCGGCHLTLSLAEQAEAERSDPPRCLHCRRILVPQ